MLNKIFTYKIFLLIFVFTIFLISFGSLLRHHYIGGKNFTFLQNVAVFFAEIPSRSISMIKYGVNLNKIQTLNKHQDKKKIEHFTNNKRNALLVLPRYDFGLSRSVVEIIDLKNFEVIHTYKNDIQNMNDQIKNFDYFPRLNIDHSPIRFRYNHPLIFEDGSLISFYGPMYKIDFCSKLEWINEKNIFHHSQMIDHEGNILIGGQVRPASKYIKEMYDINNYIDDSIVKVNLEGKIISNKSVTEILIENNIIPKNFALISVQSNNTDPIHLNDIEPVFKNTKYWKKGDLFLSIRNQSSIIHYRPSNNKVVNYITGPFAQQHDVDILSDKEITIFNNNNFIKDNETSEIIIYNFETNKFKKLFNEQLKQDNFKTNTEGLSHIFEDGALLVEEQNHGRIILYDNKGKKELEFVNKDNKGNITFVGWSRIIEDQNLIRKYKLLVKNKKCIN
jgi:hypothetical protein